MSPLIYLLTCIFLLVMIVLGTMLDIYVTRAQACRNASNPQCYSDWKCTCDPDTAQSDPKCFLDTNGEYTEKAADRLKNYQNICGPNATVDPVTGKSTCCCMDIPEASSLTSPYGSVIPDTKTGTLCDNKIVTNRCITTL